MHAIVSRLTRLTVFDCRLQRVSLVLPRATQPHAVVLYVPYAAIRSHKFIFTAARHRRHVARIGSLGFALCAFQTAAGLAPQMKNDTVRQRGRHYAKGTAESVREGAKALTESFSP